MPDYAIQVKNIKKSFYLPNHKNDSLKTAITQVFKKKDKGVNTFNALNGISFNIEKGDFFGILGRNGSGKSTLLKIISEIYQPTSGSVKRDGRVVSFIELGVGFKQELSGRENIFLNGALLGFSKQEIEDMYDDIVEFAELEKFMDQKLKNYSSGMKVRLAFSVAIRAKADILILDEVLAVGDAAFQRKCNDYFKTLKDAGKTVVLVTHSMGAVREYCNKAVVIDDGKVIYQGDSDGAVVVYNDLFKSGTPLLADSFADTGFHSVNMETSVSRDFVSLNLSINSKENIEDPIVALLFYRGGENVLRWVSDEELKDKITLKSGDTYHLSMDIQNIFPVGKYYITMLVRNRDRTVDYGVFENIASFTVANETGFQHKILWRPEITYKG